MLKQRVITAIVLLALLLPALLAASPWPFAVMTLVLIAAAGWEWGRLNEAGAAGSIASGVVLALACAAALGLGWARLSVSWGWWLALLLCVLGGTWVLRGGPSALHSCRLTLQEREDDAWAAGFVRHAAVVRHPCRTHFRDELRVQAFGPPEGFFVQHEHLVR